MESKDNSKIITFIIPCEYVNYIIKFFSDKKLEKKINLEKYEINILQLIKLLITQNFVIENDKQNIEDYNKEILIKNFREFFCYGSKNDVRNYLNKFCKEDVIKNKKCILEKKNKNEIISSRKKTNKIKIKNFNNKIDFIENKIIYTETKLSLEGIIFDKTNNSWLIDYQSKKKIFVLNDKNLNYIKKFIRIFEKKIL